MTTTRKGDTEFQGDVTLGGETVDDIKTSADNEDTGDTSLATTGYVSVHGGSAGYNDTFVDGDLSSGVLTVTHNLGQQLVHVTVANNLDEQIIPDDVTFDTTNQCSVDLTTFGTLTGTWSITVGFGAGGNPADANRISTTEYVVPGVYWEDVDNPGNWYPVRRRVVDFGAAPNATSKLVAHGMTNAFPKSVRASGLWYNPGGGGTIFDVPYAQGGSGSDNLGLQSQNSGTPTSGRLNSSGNFSGGNVWITYLYASQDDTAVTNPNGIQASQVPNFDTEEHLTGAKWVDGKDVYRKTVDTGALPNTALKTVAHGITGFDTIVALYGRCDNGSAMFPLPFTSAVSLASMVEIAWAGDGINLNLRTGNDRTTFTGDITVEYTKT